MEFWEFAKAHLGKLLICHYGWDKGAKTVKIISVAIYSRSNLRLTGLIKCCKSYSLYPGRPFAVLEIYTWYPLCHTYVWEKLEGCCHRESQVNVIWAHAEKPLVSWLNMRIIFCIIWPFYPTDALTS